jgi:hypothetical protein
MPTAIPINQVEPELGVRIRLGESVEEMRARFEGFVAQNPELNVEQESSGEIVIMSPTGAEGSSANCEITYQLTSWSRHGGGKTFDSSAMFVFANGASVRRMRLGSHRNIGKQCHLKIGKSSRISPPKLRTAKQ